MKSSDARSGDPGPYAYYVLSMLFLVLAMSLIDRNVLGILLEDIKKDLAISDTQLGLLTGPAFAVTNAIAGVPLARAADRWSRRNVVAWGLFAWSILTVGQGLTRSFGTLMVARIGVGIGEASTGPSAHSLISDYFPLRQRATAISLYTIGGHLGVWVAFLVGGWLSHAYGWRAALVAVGFPGILLALIFRISVREPKRGAIDGQDDPGDAVPWRELAGVLVGKPTFRHLTMALPLFVCAAYVLNIWGPAFLIRVHGLSKAEIGLWFGLIVGVGGGIGSIAGGLLSDRLARRDRRWYAWLPAVATLVAVPFQAGFLLAPDPWLALGLLCPAVFLNATAIAPLWTANQAISPLRMRATSYSIIHLGISALSGGLAPFAVGAANDLLAPQLGELAVRYSLCLIVVTNLWGSFHAGMAGLRLPKDIVTA
ncbi:MAG: MFS transporter [Deltaproteobacteria bacterium]|nr:MFS transporter [Deltaproteobacteria bacterium]